MIKTFGPNNLTPSKLCFGTMQFGDGASAKDSEEMYLKCRENEVNFFDCILPLVIIFEGKIKLGTPASNNDP